MNELLEIVFSLGSLLGSVVTVLVAFLLHRLNNDLPGTRVQQRAKRKATPNLKGLVRFADFFGLPTRKAIKALAGDFSAEVLRLKRARRPYMARWNVCLAWLYTFWIILKAPGEMLVRYLVKTFSGIGK